MDTICLDDVKNLISRNGGAHVSIFMPTHHAGGENPQDPIRLRNLMRVAEEKLVARGLRPAEARALLAPAESLYTDNLFWRQQGDGLALFIESSMFMYYRLPKVMPELVGVSDRYYIKPLISLISECGWFYVLSLSRHENRLLQCTSVGSVRISLGDVPKSMPEALRYDTSDNRMQYHIAPQVGGSNFGASTAIQSGEESRPNYDKRNLIQYLNQVSKGISKLLKEEKAPMVLSAVDYIHPFYRSVNEYPNLLEKGIYGNPDGVSDDVLREQAWKIVKPYFEKIIRDAVGEYNRLAGTGRTAKGLEEVIDAAKNGRVRFLFMAENVQQWGRYDFENNHIEIHKESQPGDEDLMDLVAYLTVKQNGAIYELKPEEVPGDAPVSAVLRY
ncbi:MAG: hypothetical protein NUV31_01835 [Dehalococcoidales bacterium]|jgi:hypothetical protein|nr:hypothetical protein [Dehalococcoidales bacterium]